MFRLTIFDTSFRIVDTIEHRCASTLIDMGKMLQRVFGAYYRLSYHREITQ